jgi:hypothetical protein
VGFGTCFFASENDINHCRTDDGNLSVFFIQFNIYTKSMLILDTGIQIDKKRNSFNFNVLGCYHLKLYLFLEWSNLGGKN